MVRFLRFFLYPTNRFLIVVSGNHGDCFCKFAMHLITWLLHSVKSQSLLYHRTGTFRSLYGHSVATPILIICLCLSPLRARGGITRDIVSDTIYFRKGYSILQPDYENNGARLNAFVDKVSALRADSAVSVRAINIIAYASPEGDYSLNKRLSRKRAEKIASYLRNALPHLSDTLFKIEPKGINWEGLAQMFETSDMKHGNEVLDILSNVPEMTYRDGKPVDSRLKHLMDLRGGRPYMYMLENFFPLLRNGGSLAVCHVEQPEEPAKSDVMTTPQAQPDTTGNVGEIVAQAEIVESAAGQDMSVVSETEAAGKKPLYMSVSTNMLYDAALVPNLGVEFYLGKNLSIAGNWKYAWWSNSSRARFWRIYGGDLALRWWFGPAASRKPLTGHHAGIYGQAFIYDFEFGGRGQMAGKPGCPLWERAHYAAGLEYGYALPVSSRFNIDFTLGVGYMGGRYYDYRYMDGHYVWQKTSRRNWFGPTKLEISLIWLLGRGNCNVKKGGAK